MMLALGSALVIIPCSTAGRSWPSCPGRLPPRHIAYWNAAIRGPVDIASLWQVWHGPAPIFLGLVGLGRIASGVARPSVRPRRVIHRSV